MTFESRLIFLTNPIVETHDFAILRIFFAHENVLEAATVVRTLAAIEPKPEVVHLFLELNHTCASLPMLHEEIVRVPHARHVHIPV